MKEQLLLPGRCRKHLYLCYSAADYTSISKGFDSWFTVSFRVPSKHLPAGASGGGGHQQQQRVWLRLP